MPKYELVLNAGEYAPVADRITLFYSRYPSGRILTRLISQTEREITVQAYVFRSLTEARPSATGLASERVGDGDVNTVACLENTETSAIGRALANLGLTASSNRPSREEIAKANRERSRAIAEHSRRPREPSQRLTRTGPSVRSGLQSRADRVMDALDLLAQAERAGLSQSRARRLRTALSSTATAPATIERVEHVLRAWNAWRHTKHLRL
jgi:hypothetical protein